jgi:hypothetical protein
MKLLSVAAAKSTWLFDMADLNPEGKAVLSRLIDFLKKTYKFTKAPSAPNDLDPNTKSLAFDDGFFRTDDNRDITVNFSIYSDGVSAMTWSSTSDSDAFIRGALTSASQALGLHYPSMIRSQHYVSEVNIQLDHSLSNLCPKLNHFANQVSSAIDPKNSSLFEFGGASFWTDSFSAVIKMEAFTIERKAGAPFSENRYFSKAPLQTKLHLSLLNDFERLLTS